MSATDRRNAARLLSKLKQFAGQDMKNVKLKRCMREYFTVSFETPDGGGGTMKMTGAYSYGGHYVGNTRFAHRLAKRGIMPELSDDDHSVCSIGRSHRDGKWYGWSHRAIYGFKKGSRVNDEDHLCSEHLPVGFQAQNEDEKREMAVAFARSVG